jgi:hypothetical protein
MTDVHLSAETTGRPHADLLVEIDHVVFGYDASRTILNDVSLAFGAARSRRSSAARAAARRRCCA